MSRITPAPGDVTLETLVSIDDDASTLYAEAGLPFDLRAMRPFTDAERARWQRALDLARVFVATDADRVVGFAALGVVDGAPYLDQLSIRRSAMRRGYGSRLLEAATSWARARGDVLWLTTYGHLPFNGAFYERRGFTVVPETDWGADIAHHVAEQRRYLPAPEQRVAMRRTVDRY